MTERYEGSGYTQQDYWDMANKKFTLGDKVRIPSKTATGSDVDSGIATLVKKYTNYFYFESATNKHLTYSIQPIDCLKLEIVSHSDFMVRSNDDAINDIFDAFN